MKTIILIETAKELIEFANPTRAQGDETPFLGNKAKLIFENNMMHVRLEKDGFKLSEKITVVEVLKELADNAHLQIHIT